MAKEIERKFLVEGAAWRAAATGSMRLRQAYLATTPAASVRVRIIDGRTGLLTIKSATPGAIRDEFEYAIPVEDAEQLIGLRTGAVIDKIRHVLPFPDGHFTVDEFLGANAGLVMAEVEYTVGQTQAELPGWLGREVTDERRYYNASLAFDPFGGWPENAGAGAAAG